MGAKLPYQICEIGSICRMWRNTQNTHLPCSPISIHTFLAEGDRQQDSLDSFMKHFNPHLPYGRWLILNFLFVSSIYFNPHLPYGRWHIHTLPYSCIFQISIHTFLTEGDSLEYSFLFLLQDFNPHLPYGRWLVTPLLPNSVVYFNPHLPYGRWPLKA